MLGHNPSVSRADWEEYYHSLELFDDKGFPVVFAFRQLLLVSTLDLSSWASSMLFLSMVFFKCEGFVSVKVKHTVDFEILDTFDVCRSFSGFKNDIGFCLFLCKCWPSSKWYCTENLYFVLKMLLFFKFWQLFPNVIFIWLSCNFYHEILLNRLQWLSRCKGCPAYEFDHL